MNLKKKLQNPFMLVVEGFVAGAIIFFATAPSEMNAQQQAPSTRAGTAGEI